MSQCVIADCEAPVVARSWCQKHYARWRHYGSAEARLPGDAVDGCRVCVRCERDKPLVEFRVNRATCKACVRAADRGKYAANREERLAKTRAWREQNKDLARQLSRDWYSRNKDRSQATSLAWRAANPDRAKQARADWEAANPNYSRDWSRENSDRSAGYSRRYRAAHPELVTERTRSRRARIREGALDQNALDQLWTGECGICEQPVDRSLPWPDPLSKSIDHIVPLSKGGGHTQENTRWAHLICNMRKGDRTD